MVQVPAGGQDRRVAPCRHFVQKSRRIPGPNVDDGVLRQTHSVDEHFLPDDWTVLQVADNVDDALDVFLLQALVGCDVVRPHVLRDGSAAPPALEADLVAAQMDVFIRKEARHLPEQALHEFVRPVFRRVDWAEFPCVGAFAFGQQFGMRDSPRARVSRSVELRDRPNAALPRVLDDGRYVLLGVHQLGGVSASGTELREGDALVRETVVVDDVPVEDVHFVVHHAVQNLLEYVFAHEVARSVHEQAAVFETRLVHDISQVGPQLWTQWETWERVSKFQSIRVPIGCLTRQPAAARTTPAPSERPKRTLTLS